jgi:glutamyl-tRNA synthetase
MDELAGVVSLDIMSRAPTKFDPAEVMNLTARLLHETPYAEVAGRIGQLGLSDDEAEALWLAVRGNLSRLAEIGTWREIVFGQTAGVITEADYLEAAAAALPAEPFDDTTWGQWTDALKVSTGRKGKPLFMPLRQALTGLEHGPELKGLLPLMGRAKVLARLHGQSA